MHTYLEELAELYSNKYLHAIVRDFVAPDDIDDVVQDIALRACEAIERYKQNSILIQNFRPWLRRIAINTCITHLRNKIRQQSGCISLDVAADAGWQMESDQAEPEEMLQRQEMEDAVAQLLLMMNHLDGRILARRFINGEGYAELAKEFQLPPSTIRSKVSRAIAFIRNDLKRRRTSSLNGRRPRQQKHD